MTGPVLVLVAIFMLDPSISPFQALLHGMGFQLTNDVIYAGSLPIIFTLVGFFSGAGMWIAIQYGALEAIPTEVIEAATIDGCNAWQVFRNVKLPFLAPAFTYNITVTVVGALSAFDIIVAMTGGGPGSATRVLNALTLQQFGQGYFGLSSMTSLVITVMVIIIAIPLVRWLRSRELES